MFEHTIGDSTGFAGAVPFRYLVRYVGPSDGGTLPCVQERAAE